MLTNQVERLLPADGTDTGRADVYEKTAATFFLNGWILLGGSRRPVVTRALLVMILPR